MKFRSFCLLAGLFSMPALAEPPMDAAALQLLEKMATASQKLTYSGVFVYQSGNSSETSRIAHLVDGDNEFERLEVLDGSPREVIRRNEEVRCFLPASKVLVIDRKGSKALFPRRTSGSLAGLSAHYIIRMGSAGRVAGVVSQMLLIEPRDEFRYGHRLWIDPHSGLMLKATLVGEGGAALESFAFTEVKIGGPLDREMLKSPMEAESAQWQVQHVRSSDTRGDEGQWLFKNDLPGFRRTAGMKRQLRPNAPEGIQLIYSDGLASVSVFIEPLVEGKRLEPTSFSVGSVNVYKRQSGNHQLIVMGDVPHAALRRLGDGIEPRKK